jgi:hypothetical protein
VAPFVYAFCALTALLCALLLFQHYRRSRYRLLLWSGLCFVFLTASNVLLVLDKMVPTVDLSAWRTITAFAGMLILIYGLIYDAE